MSTVVEAVYYVEGYCRLCGRIIREAGLEKIEVLKCPECGSSDLELAHHWITKAHLNPDWWEKTYGYIEGWVDDIREWAEVQAKGYKKLLERAIEILGFNPFEIELDDGRIKAFLREFTSRRLVE